MDLGADKVHLRAFVELTARGFDSTAMLPNTHTYYNTEAVLKRKA